MRNKTIVTTALSLMLLCSMASATTLVDENFDDQSYSSPLSLYVYDALDEDVPYSSSQAYGGSGYSIEVDHYQGDIMAILNGMTTYLPYGIYFRYYVYYPSSYLWPGEGGVFENVKMFKIAGDSGEEDVEFIYKNSVTDGPTDLQLYWFTESDGGSDGGTGTGNTTLGGTLSSDVWHKIEIFILIPESGTSTVHVQVDDYDVYESTDADIALPASEYTNTQQFISIRASNAPASGQGTWHFDEITVVYNEGDLCDNEPGSTDTTAPTISNQSPSGQQSCGSNPQSITLSCDSDESATCRYGTDGAAWSAMTEMSTTGGTSHSQALSLSCGASYQYDIICRDSSDNESDAASVDFSIIAEASAAGFNAGSGALINAGSGAAFIVN